VAGREGSNGSAIRGEQHRGLPHIEPIGIESGGLNNLQSLLQFAQLILSDRPVDSSAANRWVMTPRA